eukprot:2448267-Alexandrium_andersonii.AAC.1
MSASLVGSEMCIRDSRTIQRQRQWRQTGQSTEAAQRKSKPGLLTGQSTQAACLLYTSDAADDM